MARCANLRLFWGRLGRNRRRIWLMSARVVTLAGEWHRADYKRPSTIGTARGARAQAHVGDRRHAGDCIHPLRQGAAAEAEAEAEAQLDADLEQEYRDTMY
jgi:hypothetical protein